MSKTALEKNIFFVIRYMGVDKYTNINGLSEKSWFEFDNMRKRDKHSIIPGDLDQ